MEHILKQYFSILVFLESVGKHLFSDSGHETQQHTIFRTVGLFQLFSDFCGKGRTGSVGGHSKGQIALPYCCRDMEAALVRRIRRINLLPGLLRIPDNQFLHLPLIGGGKNQQGMGKITLAIAPGHPLDPTGCGQFTQGVSQPGTDNPDPRSGFQQGKHLAFRHCAAADHNTELISDVQTDWIHDSAKKKEFSGESDGSTEFPYPDPDFSAPASRRIQHILFPLSGGMDAETFV